MSSEGVDIELAEKELQGINWPSLANALGIDRNTETRLFEAHMGDRTGAAMREMLRHWIDNYDTSWDMLARALMSIWSYRRNGAYLYNKYVNPECFTPKKISEELSFIEDWFELAHPFFLNSDKLREAVKDAKSDEEKRLGAITAWYNTYDTPSWEEIACILEELHPDYTETAKQLRKKYLPTVSLQPSRSNDLAKLGELNEKNAFEETSDVQDWYALGRFLGIPENELIAIEEAKARVDDRRLEVLILWRQSEGDKASWLKLGQAVSKIHSNLGMGRKLVKRARIKQDVKISEQFPESVKTHNTTKLDLTAANASKEIAGIPWKVLSSALGLDHSPVDSLETQHCDYAGNNEFVEMVLEYWVEHFNTSWEVLAVTMQQVPQLRTTGAYLYNKYVNPDSFTIEKVVGVLSGFDSWLQLFYSLFDDAVVFRKVIKAIQAGPNTHGVTDYWMRYGDRPSWEKVAAAIELCFPEKADLAKKLRSSFLPSMDSQDFTNKALKPLPLKDLNSASVLEATKEIKDWFGLGWFLGLDDKTLTTIETKEELKTADDGRKMVIDIWLEWRVTDASWQMLGEAIRKMSQHYQLSERILMNFRETSVDTGTTPATSSGDSDTAFIAMPIPGTTGANKEVEDAVEELMDQFGAIHLLVKKMKKESGGEVPDIGKLDSAMAGMRDQLEELKGTVSAQVTATLGVIEEEDVLEAMEVEESSSTSLSKSVLDKMEIIFKDTADFTGNSACSLNWEHYGCRLSIPKGSIGKGEKGTVQIYGIHSGPFKVPDDMKLVSAIYYITLSHELLKPATLEIQHCCNTIYGPEGDCNLTFLTVSADDMAAGSPYQLGRVDGGQFRSDGETYAMIRRTSFSPYIVAFINWVKYMAGYPTPDVPLAPPNPINYAVLYCLIATTDQGHWRIMLRLTEYIIASQRFFLLEEKKRRSSIVRDSFKKVRLTSDTVTIDISREGQPEEILGWNGNSLTFAEEWEIEAEANENTVKLQTSEVGHELASTVEISIQWKNDFPPIKSSFRIHYLGLEEAYSFPVTVPQPYRQQLSSTMSSLKGSIEGDMDRLLDPPDLVTFMKRVASKAPDDRYYVPLHLLSPDGYRNFKAISKDQKLDISEKYELCFEMWEKEVEETDKSWSLIIAALNNSDNHALAKKLQDCYF